MTKQQENELMKDIESKPAQGYAESVPPSCSADSPAKVLYEFERLIERAAGQVVVLIRHGDRIIIRDNSGVSGLTGELLMQKSLALLDELFPSNAEAENP